ncbi:MAG TPA: hypothetical protein VJA26_18535 [Gammaproteobacteria bacterium]|nr:hypothetical protein [Gammaproteobacteria bacterium]
MSAASGAVSRLGPTHVHIDYNGSGHAGDQSLPIAELLARMETDAIETFWGDCCSLAHAAAYYGEKDANGEKAYADLGPIYPDTPHAVRFCGNFETYAHAFAIDTDDAEVIEVLCAAIAANRRAFSTDTGK